MLAQVALYLFFFGIGIETGIEYAHLDRVCVVPLPGPMSHKSIPQQIIDESILQGIDPSLPLAVAWRESRFQQYAIHRNVNGSRDWGLMGLNDHTVKVLHVDHPFDARQSIIAGVGLLAVYLDQFHGNKRMALCAYARGPERCR